eukprot:m.137726 g.137726  ORF g.137726 m.137726 type:complete len:60 (-) comp16059_c0_seq6:954-1133(-)
MVSSLAGGKTGRIIRANFKIEEVAAVGLSHVAWQPRPLRLAPCYYAVPSEDTLAHTHAP